ncbi:MAG TPA: GNAT family N-acetyltransferase [Terriglobales bacterium]|nr:GNAT family N-acetyltransferase [Terriglobales bacterium]
MSATSPQSTIVVRDLESLADLESMLRLEREVWGLRDADVTPLAFSAALRAAGSIIVGAFDGARIVGFALAFPSLEHGKMGFHSHMLAVHPSYRERRVGFRLKLAQRERALGLGINEMTWTFDPLRSANAHLNFERLGVISDSYRPDFYGPQTSSPLHRNGTDRLWVTWRMDDDRVERRLHGNAPRPETLDALRHLEPLVRFNGDRRPAQANLDEALSRQRVAIEIPGDIERMESEDRELAREWRLATRSAFVESLRAGFVVKEFCRWLRGQQGPGAYLLERAEGR